MGILSFFPFFMEKLSRSSIDPRCFSPNENRLLRLRRLGRGAERRGGAEPLRARAGRARGLGDVVIWGLGLHQWLLGIKTIKYR